MAKKDEQGYLGNPKLRRERAKRSYTADELSELLKCSLDIEYFAEKYATIITLDKGEQIIDLYDYQRELLTTMANGDPEANKYNTIVLSPRQSGKCLIGNSKILIRDKNKTEMEITLKDFHELLAKK
jgi:hypothetical protein